MRLDFKMIRRFGKIHIMDVAHAIGRADADAFQSIFALVKQEMVLESVHAFDHHVGAMVDDLLPVFPAWI